MEFLVIRGPLPWWGILILVTGAIILGTFFLYIMGSAMSATGKDTLVPVLQKKLAPFGFILVKSEMVYYHDPKYFSTEISQAYGSNNQYQVTRRVMFLDAQGKEQKTVVNYRYNFGTEQFEFLPSLESFQ